MFKHLSKLPAFVAEAPKKGLFKDNRQRLLTAFRARTSVSKGFLFFKGPIEQPVYDDDNEFLTIPEAHFSFLFGVGEPETFGLIDIETGRATLLVKVGDPQKSFWMKIKTLKEFAEEFEVEEARPLEDLKSLVSESSGGDQVSDVFVLGGCHPETKRAVWSPLAEARERLPAERVHESAELYGAFTEVRSAKSAEELRLVAQASQQAGLGLLGVLANLPQGLNELQLACHVKSVLKFLGDFDTSEEPVVAFGENCGFPRHVPGKFRVARKQC